MSARLTVFLNFLVESNLDVAVEGAETKGAGADEEEEEEEFSRHDSELWE